MTRCRRRWPVVLVLIPCRRTATTATATLRHHPLHIQHPCHHSLRVTRHWWQAILPNVITKIHATFFQSFSVDRTELSLCPEFELFTFEYKRLGPKRTTYRTNT